MREQWKWTYRGIDQAYRETAKKAEVHLMLNLARTVKGNKNDFYRYICCWRKVRENVCVMLNGAWYLLIRDMEKDKVLNVFFYSIFFGGFALWSSRHLRWRRQSGTSRTYPQWRRTRSENIKQTVQAWIHGPWTCGMPTEVGWRCFLDYLRKFMAIERNSHKLAESRCLHCLWERQEGESWELQVVQLQLNPWKQDGPNYPGNQWRFPNKWRTRRE